MKEAPPPTSALLLPAANQNWEKPSRTTAVPPLRERNCGGKNVVYPTRPIRLFQGVDANDPGCLQPRGLLSHQSASRPPMTRLVLDPFPHQVCQRRKRRRGCKSAFFFFSTAHLVIRVAGMLIASTCNSATFIQSCNRAEQITAHISPLYRFGCFMVAVRSENVVGTASVPLLTYLHLLGYY